MQRSFTLFFITLLFFTGLVSKAQHVSVETSFTGTLTLCQSPISFSVVVKNTSSTETLTDVLLNPHMNVGMKYVTGSLGSSSGTVTLANVNARYNPDFSLGTLTPGESDTITFQATANCELLSSLGSGASTVNNKTDVKYKISSTNYTEYEPNEINPVGSPSYNVLYPDIEISVDGASASLTAGMGDHLNRRLRIRNNGFGKLDTIKFTVQYLSAALENVNVNINGSVLTPSGSTGSTLTFLLTDFSAASGSISGNTGNGDTYLDYNEVFYISDSITVLSCSASTQTDYKIEWGCDASVCNENKNNAQASAYVSIPLGHPVITWPSLSTIGFCTEEEQDFIHTITNTATLPVDKALDFSFRITATSGSTLDNLKIWNASTSSYVSLPSGSYTTYASYSVGINFQLTTDLDGVGGLEDLDGDGYYDDLPAGASIKIYAGLTTVCLANNSSCNTARSYLLQSCITYYDNCGTYFAPSCGEDLFNIPSSGASITGPTDLADGESGVYYFNAAYDVFKSSRYNCGGSSALFTSTIHLPPGYTYADDSVDWISGGVTYRFPCSISGDTLMTIIGGGYNGNYKITFVLDCEAGASAATSSVLSWEMKFRCESSCSSCEINLLCASFTVYNHCIECDGYVTTSMSVDRISMGWPAPAPGVIYKEANFSSGGLTRLNYNAIDKSQYRLNAAYEYDTLHAVVKGELNNKSYTNAHVSVYYTVPYTPGSGTQAPLEVLNARFILNTATCSTAVTPTITLSGSTYTYDFEVPTACRSTGFVSGDKIDLDIKFRVRGRSQSFITNWGGINYGQNLLSDFRSQHYGLNASSEKENCQSFGDDMTIILMNPVVPSWSPTSTNHIYGMPVALFLQNAGVGYDFPGEFRPYAKIREVSYVMPDKFSFTVSGPTVQGFEGINYGIGQVWPAEYTKFQVSNPVLGAGNNYTWYRGPEWPVYGDVVASYLEYFQYFITGACDAPLYPDQTTAYMKYSLFDYTGNPSYIQLSGSIAVGHGLEYYDYSNANLTITSEAIQEGVTSRMIWPVQLCNNAAHYQPQTATNAWIAIEPRVSNITNFKIIDEEDNALPSSTYNANGRSNNLIVAVGNIGVNTCKNFNVTANYTNCVSDVLDGIDIYANWQYTAPPVKREGSYCLNPIQKDTLYLRYKTANLQDTISKLGPPLQHICDTVTYQINLLSSQFADMHDLKLEVTLPAYVTYTSGNLWRKLGSGGTYEVWNESLCEPGTPLIFSLSCDDEVLGLQETNPYGYDEKGLVGSRFASFSNLDLQLKLNLACGYDPGDYIKFHVSGVTNCGDPIHLNSQHKVRIEGLDPLDQMAVNINASTFNPETDESTVTVVVTNTGDVPLGTNVPDADRYLAVILPEGVTMITSSATPTAPVSSEPEPEGGTRYSWLLPALGVQESLTYTFKIKNTGSNPNPSDSCSPYNITLKALTQMRNDLACTTGESVCSASGTTASATKLLTVTGGNCDYCINSFAPYPGKKYVLSVWVKEPDATAVTTYTNTSASLHFEGSDVTMGPFYPKGEIIDGWQRIDTVFTIPSSSISIEVRLNNASGQAVYFDDVRVHPFYSNMKSYVYDPVSLRLWAELDENNYATLYEYDEEGGLVRVKKETERGVMTIRESRTNVVKKK